MMGAELWNFVSMLRFLFRFLSPPRSGIHLPVRVVKSPSRRPRGNVRSPPAPDRSKHPTTRRLKGKCYVVDGDTIVISGTKIRIGGIDAPELDHPWGKKAKFSLIAMCKGKTVTAEVSEEMSYDRVVAKCYLPDGTDIAAAMVEKGLALDWPKFSGGAYRHLEPEGIRKRHWRAAARQEGHMKIGS